MSQSITLLWFGNSVYIANGESIDAITVPDNADPASAIAAHCAALDPRPDSLHLIYQPEGMGATNVTCLRGPRHALAKTLGREHPIINSPTTSWAVLNPLPYDGSYTSCLFIETKNRIPRLASALLESGIELLGAWPIPALADQLPELQRDDATGIVCVTTADAALVYARLNQGTRRFLFLSSIAAQTSFPAEVNEAIAAFETETPPNLTIYHQGETWNLGTEFNPRVKPVHLPITDLLRVSHQLKLNSPANYLPPGTSIPKRFLLNLGSTFALAIAVILAGLYFLDWRSLQNDQHRRSQQAESLRQQIHVLTANREQITQARAFAAEVSTDSAAVGTLLDTLVENIPDEITLHELTITKDVFTMRGTVHSDYAAANGPYKHFRDALAGNGLPWAITKDTPETITQPSFTITGRFNK